MGPYVIDAYRVNHNVLCYGYSITIPRTGRFDVERARSQEIPQKFWSRLQKGEEIEHEGRLLTPDMVLGPDRRGLKVTYCTDTRPGPVIAEDAAGADLIRSRCGLPITAPPLPGRRSIWRKSDLFFQGQGLPGTVGRRSWSLMRIDRMVQGTRGYMEVERIL